MAIELDTSQPLRRPADLRQLVEAIRAAGVADEAHWVEWKSSLPLDALDGWFSISKQILGFANRHPDRAARFVGGLGYVVVGAEPGTVSGITPVDVAQLDDWLRGYLGNDGPVWSPTYVTVDGVEVLVVVVEPPRWGDRIFLLRKTYQPPKRGNGADKGTVFIRREAKTERANDVEHDMLQDRLLRSQRQPGLELTVGWKYGPVALTAIAATVELRRAWLDKRRAVLLRSLNEPVKEPPSADKRRAVSSGRPLSKALITASRREDRTPDQYRQEVEEHLEKAGRQLPVLMADRLAQSGANTIRLLAGNPSDRNLPKVEVELYVPGRVRACDEDDLADDDRSIPELPTPPRRYGTLRPPIGLGGPSGLGGLSGLPINPAYLRMPVVPRSIVPATLDIDNSGSARLTFRLGDLRPREQVELDAFSLVVAEPAGGTITARWQATSTGVDGVQEGSLSLTIAERALSPLDLVPYEDEPDELDES